MQVPVNRTAPGPFAPYGHACQQAYATSDSQAMQPFPANHLACGFYTNGFQGMQPQQQGGLLRQQQQQQALSAGTGSAGARNPFAAMPRELRNSQLRSNLAAVAGAFSACSGSAGVGRGASPPASAASSSMVPPTPPPLHQQQHWPACATQGAAMAAATAAVAPAGLSGPPSTYLAASSGMHVAPAQLPVTRGMAGTNFAAVSGLQQSYASTGNNNGSGSFSGGMSESACTAPLLQPLQSTYVQQQQQQHPMTSQHGDMHAVFYSDPLPYTAYMNLPALDMPASQQQQAQQVMFMSQGLPSSMPCGLLSLEPGSMAHSAAAAAAAAMSHAELLLQKQQGLQTVKQMLLLRQLSDVCSG